MSMQYQTKIDFGFVENNGVIYMKMCETDSSCWVEQTRETIKEASGMWYNYYDNQLTPNANYVGYYENMLPEDFKYPNAIMSQSIFSNPDTPDTQYCLVNMIQNQVQVLCFMDMFGVRSEWLEITDTKQAVDIEIDTADILNNYSGGCYNGQWIAVWILIGIMLAGMITHLIWNLWPKRIISKEVSM